MPTVKRFNNCKIAIFPDHAPPHLHIMSSDGTDIAVDLATMAVSHSHARKFREALEWGKANREMLMSIWSTLNPKG